MGSLIGSIRNAIHVANNQSQVQKFINGEAWLYLRFIEGFIKQMPMQGA